MKRFLHRHLWQRLPHASRRYAFFRIIDLLAPRPTPNADARHPVIVVGTFRTASGLGESARLCHDALASAGLPVRGIDVTATMMHPEDFAGFEFEDGQACAGPGTLIIHVNAPLTPLAMLRLGRVVRDKRIIGYWAWELPRLPDEWHRGRLFVHEIWAPSRFTAEAILPFAQGRPVRVVPHPVAVRHRQGVRRRDSPQPFFTVLTIFNTTSTFARKNPCAAIKAFRLAFGNDPATRLIVKTANLSFFPQGLGLIKEAASSAKNIIVIDKTMNTAEIAELYDEADVVMSLHRSEGFGLTLAEAMLRGLPVIATNWSGNVDFLSPATGIPVPYRLIPAEDPQGTYHYPDAVWADADIDAAAAALCRLRQDPALRNRLGAQAAQFATRTWSAEAYASSVRQHLGF